MSSTPHDMNLPWRVETARHYVYVRDADNQVVVSEPRAAWSSDWDSDEDFTADPRNPKHWSMVEANRRQLFKMEFIVAAANKTA